MTAGGKTSTPLAASDNIPSISFGADNITAKENRQCNGYARGYEQLE